jgi:hypothetical protein
MATSVNIHRLPNFNERATRSEKIKVTKLGPDLQRTARRLGAHTVYVCKNKTGTYFPLTFMFHGSSGFVARRTPNTLGN